MGEGRFFATALGAERQKLNNLPVIGENARLSAAGIGPSQRRNKIIYKMLMTTEIIRITATSAADNIDG